VAHLRQSVTAIRHSYCPPQASSPPKPRTAATKDRPRSIPPSRRSARGSWWPSRTGTPRSLRAGQL